MYICECHKLVLNGKGSKFYIKMSCMCDWAYENQPCEHKLH